MAPGGISLEAQCVSPVVERCCLMKESAAERSLVRQLQRRTMKSKGTSGTGSGPIPFFMAEWCSIQFITDGPPFRQMAIHQPQKSIVVFSLDQVR